jgi:mRNA interferase RelE/StbE
MSQPKSYRLVYTARAIKDIDRLDNVVKKRIGAKLLKFQEDPLKYAVKLIKSELVGEYRFRVGNYRIVFDIRGSKMIILRALHRREVYER